MAIVQTDALVLRSHRLGETSLIVTLFTRDFGLMRCVAKGARGGKSRFGAALEPGVSIAAVVYRKLTRDLQLLSKADIVAYWLALWEDPVNYKKRTRDTPLKRIGELALPRSPRPVHGSRISHSTASRSTNSKLTALDGASLPIRQRKK